MPSPENHPKLPRSFWSPHFVYLAALVAVTILVRLPAVGWPLLGNFATKNVVYAMIARNLVEGRASFWLPAVDCLRGGQRGLHLLELPLSAYLAGGLWSSLGGSLDLWGRVVSIGFSAASVVLLFGFVRRRHAMTAAVGASLVLALSPVAVVYGQCFMLEASVVFFSIASVVALDRWLARRRALWLALAGVCFALLLLTKIYMLVMLLPLGYLLWEHGRAAARSEDAVAGRLSEDGCLGHSTAVAQYQKTGPSLRSDPSTLFQRIVFRQSLAAVGLLGLAALPALVWVLYVVHGASAGGALADQTFYSLCNSAESHHPPHPLLFQADFYRQCFDDLSGVVLTPVAFMLPVVGLLDRQWRRYAAWLLAMGLLVLAMPRKFYEMNYYYVVLLPPVCIMAGLGWRLLYRRLRLGPVAVGLLLLLALGASLRYSVGPMLRVPEEDRAVLPAARAMHELTEADEPVATMHGSGIDLLYYCDRPGWAIEPDEPELARRLETCRRSGARLLAIVDLKRGPRPDWDRPTLASLRVVAEGPGYRIVELSE